MVFQLKRMLALLKDMAPKDSQRLFALQDGRRDVMITEERK